MTDRVPVLYLAPWVDYGGSDKATIDWFRWLDRSRFAPSLMTTQPSPNRRLQDVTPFAVETWALPDVVDGPAMPQTIFDVIASRRIDILHVMNSRLGFELLPDLASLPRPPKVVVQLHVEEPERNGYVRLVSTRFGNLVDAFSVVGDNVAEAVARYGVPRSKIHVIRLGVDAEEEFSPERVSPVAGLDDDRLKVLYAGRLTEQKDPALMVEILARTVALRDDVVVHVVGEGNLEEETREAVRRRGIDAHVEWHPPTSTLAGWYAACDVVLMTSVFEGIPLVGYEAMAMGVPVVAPALEGNVELLRNGGGVLIDPRDDADAYADALAGFAAHRERAQTLGAAGRERALGELSVRAMGEAHGRLYEDLARPSATGPIAATKLPDAEPDAPAAAPFSRSTVGRPTVSIITPCFNHGRYLRECLAAVRAQTWPALEIIVVDDASTDAETIELMSELEAIDDVRVVRMPVNSGPSRARNAALDLVTGTYVLPVDADNVLVPDAVERLVEQLRQAGERVGFVYPSFHYFGNRRYRFDAPAYNLFDLLATNACDTCSLFDARVFEDGVRFAEDITLGHEDWDLMLQLAARDIHGEPSRSPVMYYRKAGFTRSDLVDHAPTLFTTEGRFAELYARGPEIKARWAPGISMVALEAAEPVTERGQQLTARLAAQSCVDVEFLVRSRRSWPGPAHGPVLRRIPVDLADDAAAAMQDGLDAARGRYVLVTAGSGVDLLADPSLLEQLLRSLLEAPSAQVVALADAGPGSVPLLRRLSPEQTSGLAPHSVLVRRDASGVPPAVADADVARDAPIASLLAYYNAQHGVAIDWRHAPAAPPPQADRARGTRHLRLAMPSTGDDRARAERTSRVRHEPLLPSMRPATVRRWAHQPSWMPPLTRPLVRHVDPDTGRFTVRNSFAPPAGHVIDRALGAVHRFQLVGTAELHAGGPEGFYAVPDTDHGAPLPRAPIATTLLGHVEEVGFDQLVPVLLAFHRPLGQFVLLNGDDDPLRVHVEVVRALGYMEAIPNRPRQRPAWERHALGFLPLVRSVDHAARRHRYAAGRIPDGHLSLEIGALHTEPQPGSVPFWLEDGAPVVDLAGARADGRSAARWTVAPLTWRGPWGPKARLRAVGRRALDVRRSAPGAPSPPPARPPDGYLFGEPGAGRRAVHLAVHPVTGDRLLTPWPLEAADLGYGATVLVGHATLGHRLTDSFDPRPAAIPWASRFGRGPRQHDLPEAT